MKESFLLRTDVLPAEIPVNFSNSNLFNFKPRNRKMPYTIPYNFEVPKPNSIDTRVISLPHPIAQIMMKGFLLDFKLNITSFCKLSPFSIRSPFKVNSINYSAVENEKRKLEYTYENFFNSADAFNFSISSNDFLTEYYNFFSYRKYNSFFDFLSSPIYKRSKSRFPYMMKIDVKDFFNSIYTHALEWAIVGNKAQIKKENFNNAKDKQYNFAKEIDNVCQLINYNETNGLIIGPEFSRIMAEILLSRIDRSIFKDLYENGLEFNKDYLMFRYVDDYHIFFRSPFEINGDILKQTVISNLRDYKLNVNQEKFEMGNSVSFHSGINIINLKRTFDEFKKNFSKKVGFRTKNKYKSNFINELEVLISKNPKEKQKMIRYALKSLNSFITDKLVALDRKLIFELSLYLFNYSPEYFSSRHLSMFFMKYREFYKANISNVNADIGVLDEEISNILTKALRQNKNKFNSIYNILYTLKFIDKRVPSTLLSSLLEKHKIDYFSICCISAYILDSNHKIDPLYFTVIKKIQAHVKDYLEGYDIRSNSTSQDSHYFYIVNDFKYYPGFKSKIISQDFRTMIDEKFDELREGLKSCFKLSNVEAKEITKSAYYKWIFSYERYFEISILKSENITRDNLVLDY